jgi:hypothetical protein
MKSLFFAVALFLIWSLAPVAVVHAACIVNDEEEYAVLAAVLFPHEPDVPDRMTTDLERKAYLASVTIRLDGFHGSSYTVQDETVAAKTTGASDQTIDKDFNRKNEQACRIDEVGLLAHVPDRRLVNLVSADEIRKVFSARLRGREGRGDSREIRRSGGGTVFFSRPGFNENRTESMVDASFRADPEMGVGYRVYLRKSPKTGRWIITGATRTRMY